MPDVESTMRWKVDIAQLKSAMQEAKRSINQANAEFKTATAGMDKWSKSTSGLEAKLTQLNKVLPAQKRQLEVLEAQYAEVVQAQGENSSAAADLKLKIENQNAAIAKTEAGIKKYNEQLEEMQAAEEESQTASSKLSQTITDQEAELQKLKKAYADAVLEYGENSAEAKALAGQIENLSGDLANNKKQLNDAESAADKFDKSLEEVKDETERTSGGFSVMAGALADLVANGIRMAISAMKDFVTETIEVGKNFDASMSKVAALSGATGKDLDMLRETAKKFGSTTQFSATEAADALGYMALAGWDANQSADALGGVLDLAAASGMDLAEASDMVTDYLSAFGLSAKDSTYFADLLAYAQANANTTAEGLGEAFKNSAANMNAAGQDIETVTALLSMMANQGLKGSEAGTALNAVMRDLTSKMEDGKIMIGETSVAVQDSNGDFRDLMDILMRVEAATKGMGEAEKAAALSSVFTSESMKGLNLILNAGVGNAKDFEAELMNSSGAASEMAAVMNDNLNGDLIALNSQLEGVQISLYEKFEPALRAGVDALSSLLDAVNFVIDNSQYFIAAVGAMAAGIAAYVAYTTAIKVMKEGWMALEIVQKGVAAGQAVLNAVMAANPIGLVIAAIAALVAAFVILWNNSEEFREFWIGLWEKIKEAISKAKDKITEWIEVIKAKFQDFVNKAVAIKNQIVQAWENIKSKTLDLKNKVTEFFEGIKQGIQEKIDAAKQKVSDAVDRIKSFLGFDGLKQKVSELFEGIKEKITSPIEKAKELVTTAVEKIKGIFPIKLGNIFSGIKLPHFKISGGSAPWGIGGQGTKPSIGIDWYARGGVFDKGATLIGLGEKGAEAVVPLEHNTEWIGKVAAQLLQDLTAMNHAVSDQSGTLAGTAAVGGSVKTQNVTFNQYNNSPKALSRLEIYRDTNNLLFSSKVRLGNV